MYKARITAAVLYGIALQSSFGATPAAAQDYPSRPVTMVVPFAAGGPTDTIGRIVADKMAAALGQPVVIENVAGADGSIAVGKAAAAAGDGYTISIGNVATHVLNGAIYPLKYDLLKDLEPISLLVTAPALIVGKKTLPPNDLKELIAWLKANEDRASVGVFATWGRLLGAHFQKSTNARLLMVPYRGAAPAMQDLIGGQINLMFDQAANSLPQLSSGKVKAYAVASKTRLALAPDVPTVDEAGLSGFHFAVWHGLWASKGTPKDLIARLNAAVIQALADADVRKRLSELGQEIALREHQTPSALRAFQRAEAERWWPVVKDANIRTQ